MSHKAKITIIVEFDSAEYENPTLMLNELQEESLYTIESTENVEVYETEIREVELIK